MIKVLRYAIAVIIIFILPFTWELPLPVYRNISIVLLTIGGIAWLVVLMRDRRPFRLPKSLIPLLVFTAGLAPLLFVSPLPQYGVYWILFGIFIILITLFVMDSTNHGWDIRTWENTLLFVGIIIAIIEILRAFGWYRDWWQISASLLSPPPYALRLSGLLLGQPNLLAAYMNLVIPLTFVRLLTSKQLPKKIFWGLNLALYLVVIFFSGSRSGWLALFVSSILILGLFYKQNIIEAYRTIEAGSLKKFLNRRLVFLSLVLLLLGLLLTPLVLRRISTSQHGTLGLRLNIWGHAADLIEESPLTGKGTGALPFYYALRSEAIGGDEVYHTHNLGLQVWAETGIVGIILILIYIGLSGIAWLHTWRQPDIDKNTRMVLISFAGVAIAVLVHGILDVMLRRILPVTGLFMMAGLFYQTTKNEDNITLDREFAIVVLSMLIAFSVAGKLYLSRGLDEFTAGRQAAENHDWLTARDQVCRASKLQPESTYLMSQCSLANAWVAHGTGDTEALKIAQSMQEDALKKDPFWYMYWANLATYEWQLNDRENAVNHMHKAVEMAPNIASLRFNLAWMEEQIGETDQAEADYSITICMNPYYLKTPFFQAKRYGSNYPTENCALEYDYMAKNPAHPYLWRGWQLIETGNYQEAREQFQLASEADIHNPISYAGLGLVYQLMGEEESAKRNIGTTLFFNSNYINVLTTAGKVALLQGDEYNARRHISRAFELHQTPLSGWQFYPQAYRMYTLPSDHSPFFVKTGLSHDDQELFNWYARYLESNDEVKKAEQVSEWLDRTDQK